MSSLLRLIDLNPELGDAPLTASGLGTGTVRRLNGADPRGTVYSVRMIRLTQPAPGAVRVPGDTDEAARHVLVLCFSANAIGPSWSIDGTLCDVLFRTAAVTLRDLVLSMLGSQYIQTTMGYAVMSPSQGAKSLAQRLGVVGFRATGQPWPTRAALSRPAGPYEFRSGVFGLGEPSGWTWPDEIEPAEDGDRSFAALMDSEAVTQARQESAGLAYVQPAVRAKVGSSTPPYIPARAAPSTGPGSDVNPKLRPVPGDFARAMTALMPTAPGRLMNQMFAGCPQLATALTMVNHLLHQDDRGAAMLTHLSTVGSDRPEDKELWARLLGATDEEDHVPWGAPRVVRAGTQTFSSGYVQIFDLRNDDPVVAFMTVPALTVPPSVLTLLLQLAMADDGIVPPGAYTVRSNRLVIYLGWGDNLRQVIDKYHQHVTDHRRHEEKQAGVSKRLDSDSARLVLRTLNGLTAQIEGLTTVPSDLAFPTTRTTAAAGEGNGLQSYLS